MGGYQQLVRGDVMRGKFRKSFEKPEPFSPGEPTTVAFTIQDVYHTFRTGHRIMVQVQSSWFPLVDRNPQNVRRHLQCSRPTSARRPSGSTDHRRGRLVSRSSSCLERPDDR